MNHQTCCVPGCESPSWASFYLAEPICSECYYTIRNATYDEIILLKPNNHVK